MFADARNLENEATISADVCVIGAGAAGITLALALAESPLNVALLESGGLEVDRRSQSLNRGSTDDPFGTPLDESRVRGLGGTTNRWAGWCRPLDSIDFEARSWIPHSGWPFDRGTVDPYYREASRICEVAGEVAPAKHWPLDARLLTTREFRLSPPTAFGKKYRNDLSASKNITLFLNANATYFHSDESRRCITKLLLRPARNKRVWVKARAFVIASGGIENARLLLASAPDPAHAIGNAHDLVGRFYLDHPAFFSGAFTPSPECPSATFYTTEHVSNPGRARPVTGAFSLSEQVIREEELLGAVVRLVPRPAITLTAEWDSKEVASARRLVHSARQRRIPRHFRFHLANAIQGVRRAAPLIRAAVRTRGAAAVALRTWVECAPHRDNRVTLSGANWLGPLPHVRWYPGDDEKRAAIRLHQILASAVNDQAFGHVAPFLERISDPWPLSQTGASHHMGTTRMHDSPRHGVVDRNSRIHGMSNLYVAGSSVFPTAGYANPTLTIVALSLRLAEHLISSLEVRSSGHAS